MNSDTPKTDEQEFNQECNFDVDWADFSRTLERENQQLRDGFRVCGATLKAHDSVQLTITIPQWETLKIKALSHPAVQSLKDSHA